MFFINRGSLYLGAHAVVPVKYMDLFHKLFYNISVSLVMWLALLTCAVTVRHFKLSQCSTLSTRCLIQS